MRCPSGESWICVGALLGWATATLLLTARERAVPTNVKHIVFITLNLGGIFCSLKVLVSKISSQGEDCRLAVDQVEERKLN